MRYITQPVAGWGNFPVLPGDVYRADKESDLLAILKSGQQPSYIARGLGRSYGDTALNENRGVILHTQLNRLLSFDEETGLLECEAGVSFEEVLNVFVPRGFFLPVTPGTKFVTVGGAIANDVHGKNHHQDGTFAEHVLNFTLLIPSGEVLLCSRAENPDLFWATVGGIGLTGMILTARFRLIRIPTSHFEVDYVKAPNLEAALTKLSETDAQYRYSVAWIDCLASGSSLGRSVLMLGNHVPAIRLQDRSPLKTHGPGKLGIPFPLPGFILNSLSIQAFNRLYYARSRNARKVVHYEPFFYPLDAIHNWNRLYGKTGFIQYQVVIPPEHALAGLTRVLEKLAAARVSSFLAILKTTGPANQGLLSFPMRGFTLALDIPTRGADLRPQIGELNRVVLEHGGRVYLAKDSVTDPEIFAAMYPNLEQFKAIKRRVDPNNLLSSSMARRLRMVEDL